MTSSQCLRAGGKMDSKYNQMDEIEDRLSGIEDRLEQIHKRLIQDKHDDRFAPTEDRFTPIEDQLNEIERGVEQIGKEFDKTWDRPQEFNDRQADNERRFEGIGERIERIEKQLKQTYDRLNDRLRDIKTGMWVLIFLVMLSLPRVATNAIDRLFDWGTIVLLIVLAIIGLALFPGWLTKKWPFFRANRTIKK